MLRLIPERIRKAVALAIWPEGRVAPPPAPRIDVMAKIARHVAEQVASERGRVGRLFAAGALNGASADRGEPRGGDE